MNLDEFKARLDKIIWNCHEHKLTGARAVDATQELIDEFAVRFTDRADVVALTVEILRKMEFPCAAECAELIVKAPGLVKCGIDISKALKNLDDPNSAEKKIINDLYGLLHDDARETIPLGKMKAWRCSWRVESISVIEDNTVQVRFSDGLGGIVRFQPGFFRGVFSHLVDPIKFRQVSVVDGAVTWPGGLDLAPDAMYEGVKMGDGEWLVNE